MILCSTEKRGFLMPDGDVRSVWLFPAREYIHARYIQTFGESVPTAPHLYSPDFGEFAIDDLYSRRAAAARSISHIVDGTIHGTAKSLMVPFFARKRLIKCDYEVIFTENRL